VAITVETLRVARELRITIAGAVDAETRTLVRAWDRAWRQIATEWDAAIADIQTLDEPPTFTQLLRRQRAANAVQVALDELGRLTDRAAVRITTAAGQIVDATADLEARQIATQLPHAGTSTAEFAVRFDRVNADALRTIVERTTQQVTSLARPLSTEATEAMLRVLTQGVTQGLSPRTAARRMLQQVEGAFAGGLTRAMTIARTELLDAYRAAARSQQDANRDVLAGWVWHAQLDDRTCLSCVARHGTLYSLDDPGPEDHQNGRCARMPKTKPWADLGFTSVEPADRIQAGADWFAAQPHARRLAIAGPARLELLDTGQASLADMSALRRTAGWRDSYGVPAVKDLTAA
jgi:SPP1 gp7 family putative phage head morphogenesis protein